MRMGSYDAAEKYYAKNLAPQGSYTPGAVIGLVRIAALQNDQQALLALLRQFLALKDPSIEEPLIQAVRMEKGRSEIGMALDLAGEYVQRFPDGTWRDEADYLTAQLLEADSQFRDIARARSLYAGIVNGRPESVVRRRGAPEAASTSTGTSSRSAETSGAAADVARARRSCYTARPMPPHHPLSLPAASSPASRRASLRACCGRRARSGSGSMPTSAPRAHGTASDALKGASSG